MSAEIIFTNTNFGLTIILHCLTVVFPPRCSVAPVQISSLYLKNPKAPLWVLSDFWCG